MENFESLKRLDDARNYAINKWLREYLYDKIREEPGIVTNSLPKDMDKTIEDIETYIGKRSKKGRYKYIMFTINFKQEVSFEEAMKKWKKYIKKKWIKNSKSCMEWRDMDDGMHIHSKVEIDKEKNTYECKREVYNTFKDLVGNNQHVNTRYSNTENCFEDYIKGLKKGKPKECLAVTKIMREKYGLKEIYLEDEGKNTLIN